MKAGLDAFGGYGPIKVGVELTLIEEPIIVLGGQ